jgi:hypothetical protein
MKISYFPNQAALNSTTVMAAFLESCRAQGWSVIENSMDADAVVIWSVVWSGRMRNNQVVYNHYRSQNKPVFILEVGNLCRGITWRVSLNHVNRLGVFGTPDIDVNRPAKLGIELRNNEPATDILIACQRQDSLQWQGQSSRWIQETIDEIRKYSTRPIVIRPHPRYPINIKLDNVSIQQPLPVRGTYDDFDLDYSKFYCVVNHNSGPSVQAAIAGIHTICDRSSLAWPVGIEHWQLENPPIKNRNDWFINLCHTEYLVEEIAQGIPLKILQKVLIS